MTLDIPAMTNITPLLLDLLGCNRPHTGRDASVSPRCTDWGYSLRRFYVDEFYTRHIGKLLKGSDVLDLGGKKVGKRGAFDISKYGMNVTYVNIDPISCPDIICNATNLSLCSNRYDVVICSEVLMYVEPHQTISEIHRVLMPGGRLLMCNPFLFPEVSSERDHDHYHLTKAFFLDYLQNTGFINIIVEPQGEFHAVLANMLKMYVNAIAIGTVKASWIRRKIIAALALWLQCRAFGLESREELKRHPFYSRFAIGFGVVAEKK